MAADLGFDVSITGFSIPEIDSLVEGLSLEEPSDPEDDCLPSLEEGWGRCQPGDWQLTVYKRDWEDELARRKVHDITDLPDPLPHPDDVVICLRTGEVNSRVPDP